MATAMPRTAPSRSGIPSAVQRKRRCFSARARRRLVRRAGGLSCLTQACCLQERALDGTLAILSRDTMGYKASDGGRATCSNCREHKPIDEFRRHPDNALSARTLEPLVHSTCRSCEISRRRVASLEAESQGQTCRRWLAEEARPCERVHRGRHPWCSQCRQEYRKRRAHARESQLIPDSAAQQLDGGR